MSKKRVIIYLSLIIGIGFAIRFYRLTSSPAGLYIDEASIGYNAYSLLTTGRDEHGKSIPLFFEAFGEYKLPVYIYSVFIAQIFFGPSSFAVRLPAVLFGTATILCIYFLCFELVREQNKKITVGLVAAGLLAISPWHLQFTRPGFEASAAIFFIILALAFFFRSIRTHRIRFFLVAVLSFSLSLYSYNSVRIVLPLVLFILFILYLRKIPFWWWICGFLLGLTVIIPFIRYSMSPAGLARAQQVSIFYQPQPQNLLKTFANQYWKNVSPDTLFIRGEPTIAHLTSYRWGLLYLIEAPFVVLGLVALIKKHTREYIFMITFLFICFIPPAITTLSPHALRGSLAIPVMVFVSAYGFVTLCMHIKKDKLRKIVVVFYTSILGISLINFLNVYHYHYVPNSGWDWQVGIKRVTDEVLRIRNGYEEVYFAESGAARVSYLYYLKVDPLLYQTSPQKDALPPYFFNVTDPGLIPVTGKNLYVTPGVLEGWQPLEEISYPNGEIAYRIYVI
ncbi:MAG: glycosyltransferase family 39 protein [Patescibacteria group bacterium]